jgi:uncharacterized protein (DUF885 family)
MTAARDLADRFHQRWLHANPFAATSYGIPGYDDLLPDNSADGQQAWRAEVEQFLREAAAITRDQLTPADAVTLDCVTEAAAQELAGIDLARDEYTVTAMHYAGPPFFLAVAARTVLVDQAAAEAYLTRLRRSGTWLDQIGERLRAGADRGRLPIAPLAEQAINWAEGVLASPGTSPLLSPRPPQGWSRAAAWESERQAAVTELVHPALARWVTIVRELLPRARTSDKAGLVWLPGGEADYARAVRIYTTLPRSPEDLHQTGLDHVAALEARAVELGTCLGLSGRDEVFAALRDSAGKIAPEEAVRKATVAVRRAEERAAEFFPAPLPPPCEVTPMPEVVALGGAAPHYTPPRLDGGRPGTFWFNTRRPTAGTGWDIDVVAFHEAVPGHHLQLSRLQLLTDLPALQRQRSLPVFSEGWGLYAEQLAEEAGLYADDRGLLGSVSTALMRAVRLVVDTGIHGFGWSRERAIEYAADHVPMPREFMAAEIDRYIVMPGQALAYLTGKLEITRLRDEARRRLGPAFSLPAFHAAVLDHGSLPMPTLTRSIGAWLDATGLVERGLPVPAPLEFEETVRLGDQHQPVPQFAGGLAARGGRDDGAEQGLAPDPDHRGPDVQADVVERLVVRVLDLLIEFGALGGAGQRRGQPRFRQGLRDHLGVLPSSLHVEPGADGGVQGPENARTAVLGGRGADPHRSPGPAHALAVLLALALALVLLQVQVSQRHDPPFGPHRPDLFHLQHPPGGDPRPRAQRIEPELHGFTRLRLFCHTCGNKPPR